MISLADVIRELARAVAVELYALQSQRATYSQDNPPEGMTPEQYLRHCRRADWPNSKEGRLRVTRRSDFEAWRAENAHKIKPKLRVVRDDESPEDVIRALSVAPSEGAVPCRVRRKAR